ncbi:hypothetical protein ACE6H2_026464 [Prunus campanulata]
MSTNKGIVVIIRIWENRKNRTDLIAKEIIGHDFNVNEVERPKQEFNNHQQMIYYCSSTSQWWQRLLSDGWRNKMNRQPLCSGIWEVRYVKFIRAIFDARVVCFCCQSGLRLIWEKYYEEAHVVVYVIHATCPSRFEDSKSALVNDKAPNQEVMAIEINT